LHRKHAGYHPHNNSKICIVNSLTLLLGHNNPAAYRPDWLRISQDENPEGVRSPISSFPNRDSSFCFTTANWLQVNPEETAKVRLPSSGVATLISSNYPRIFFVPYLLLSPVFSVHLSLLLSTIVLHLRGRNMPIFCRRNLTS